MFVFPMAGLSSRFTKAGYELPKYMLEAGGKTVFAHVVGGFDHYFKSDKFVFIYRDVAGTKAFLEKQCKALGIADFILVELDQPTGGQAETVYLGLQKIQADPSVPLTVYNIDTICPQFRHPSPDCLAEIDGYLEVFRGAGDAWSFARTVSETDDTVIETAEKRRISDLCSTGLYYFARTGDFMQTFEADRARPASEREGGEFYIAPMYNDLIRAGKKIIAVEIPLNAMIPCGVPHEYEAFKAAQDAIVVERTIEDYTFATTRAVKPRVAILLYGYLRTYQDVAYSFMKNVADLHDADIFYFGPRETDKPQVGHSGKNNFIGSFIENPKNNAEKNKEQSNEELFRGVYGTRLKSYHFHSEGNDKFKAVAAAISQDQWLFMLDPSRFFSMAYNMSGAYDLMRAYEEKIGTKYDTVILTRPDLCFYRPLTLNIQSGEVHIADGEGVHPFDGTRLPGNVPAMFYKNVHTGELVETGHTFNDQIIALQRPHAHLMGSLYQSMIDYIPLRLPMTPESMLFFHFVTRSGLRIVKNDHWVYEIVRFGQKMLMNVTDLPLLYQLQRHHPIVKKWASEQRVKFFLKDVRRWVKFILLRMRG